MHGIAAQIGNLVHIAPHVPAIITCLGVTLHLDWAEECFYLELAPLHSRKIRQAALLTISGLGLEVMDYGEHPPELRPDGATRHWLAADDGAALVATSYV